jgi:hypothetical protein
MSAASDWLEGQIGTHLLRTGSWTKPTAVWVALYTVLPNDAGTGGTEVSTTDTGYARIQHGHADDKWTAPVSGNGEFSNIGVVQFPAPVGTNWGTIVGFGLHSAVTGGDFYLRGAMDQNVTVNAGDPAPAYAEGALKVIVA